MTHCNETKYKLLKLTQFNRIFVGAVSFCLYLYSNNLSFELSMTTKFLLSFVCITTIAYGFANEIIVKNIKDKMLGSLSECFNIAKINALSASLLITTLIFCTGNLGFIGLFLIPILNCQFFSGSRLSYSIVLWSIVLLAAADLTSWNTSASLIGNQGANFPTFITVGTVMLLVSSLGMIHSNYSKYQKERSTKFHSMATTDALTDIPNRMEFNTNILREYARAKRHKNKLTLAIFDIDFFKKVNDTYGHTAGDFILKEIGKILKKETRDCDFVARYGGEEFVLILPDTEVSHASELLDRLRGKIENHTFKSARQQIDITISIGVAEYSYIDKNAEEFINRADSALYKAKENGRNRVEVATLSDSNVSISYDLKVAN